MRQQPILVASALLVALCLQSIQAKADEEPKNKQKAAAERDAVARQAAEARKLAERAQQMAREEQLRAQQAAKQATSEEPRKRVRCHVL